MSQVHTPNVLDGMTEMITQQEKDLKAEGSVVNQETTHVFAPLILDRQKTSSRWIPEPDTFTDDPDFAFGAIIFFAAYPRPGGRPTREGSVRYP